MGRHKMVLTCDEPPCDQLPRPHQVNKPNAAAIPDYLPAIGLLQGRAGNHSTLAATAPAVDNLRDRGEPRPPIGIVERVPAFHLCHVLGWVEPVALFKFPTEPRCQAQPDCGLAGPRNAHDDGNLWLVNELAHGPSPPISAVPSCILPSRPTGSQTLTYGATSPGQGYRGHPCKIHISLALRCLRFEASSRPGRA